MVIDDVSLSYQLVRSVKRKTLGLQVKQGKIVVRAPYYLAQKHIDALVKKKSSWLKNKVLEQSLHKEAKESLFVDGGYLWVFGQYKKLTIVSGKRAGVYNTQDELQVVLVTRKSTDIVCTSKSSIGYNDEEVNTVEAIQFQRKKVKRQLEKWFKEQAITYFAENLPYFAAQTELFPKDYQVRQYKARWGSCNSRQALSFNYLLVMTPKWVIDYVIIHELCHLRFLNHSAEFWQLVAKHYPLYKSAKVWLKTHQHQLSWTL